MVGRGTRRNVFDQARTLVSWVRSSSPKARSKKRACCCQLASWVSAASGEPADGCRPATTRTVSLTSAPLAEIAPVISTVAGGRGTGPERAAGAGDGRVRGPPKNGKSQLAAGSDDMRRKQAVAAAAFRMRVMDRWLGAVDGLDGRGR